jgi:O-antigen biosynthesis protein WbqP
MKKNTPNLATDLLGDPSKYLLFVGQFIRKLSIDELPNLLNIVKGEMLFIGPRPALYNQTELILKRKNAGIDTLKPGITGWAQVNGRDELTNDQKLKYDYEYLKNNSLKMDLKILYFTFLNVIRSRGISH